MDEEATAIRCLWDSGSFEKIDTYNFSHANEKMDVIEPRRWTRSRCFTQCYAKFGTHLAVTVGEYVEYR